MALKIDAVRCPQNHRCPLLPVCPAEAITQEGCELPTIDLEKCIDCGKCMKVCGMQAVYKVQQHGKPM